MSPVETVGRSLPKNLRGSEMAAKHNRGYFLWDFPGGMAPASIFQDSLEAGGMVKKTHWVEISLSKFRTLWGLSRRHSQSWFKIQGSEAPFWRCTPLGCFLLKCYLQPARGRRSIFFSREVTNPVGTRTNGKYTIKMSWVISLGWRELGVAFGDIYLYMHVYLTTPGSGCRCFIPR